MATDVHHETQQPIVVGVDGTAGSLAALDLAAGEAHRRRLPLRLVRAVPAGSANQSMVNGTLIRVCTVWPGLVVTARTVTGDPAEVLTAASRAATLVVVGRRVADGPPGHRSVSARVATNAFCPTIVVPAGAPDSKAPVLLALGMSAEAEAAVQFGFAEAALRDVPLLAAWVWAGVPAPSVGVVSPYGYDVHRAQSAADRMVATALAGWDEKYPDVRVERMPLYDPNPAATLLEASALAGLVVIGARRQVRSGDQPLGTVARTLVQHANRPVAVVPNSHQW